MKVSIIIPMYNAEETIESVIESVTNQLYNNIELVIIDDGSTDNSAEICKELTQLDSRISYYYQPNSGVSSARNYGLSKITGELVCFIDADDKITNNFVSELTRPIFEEEFDMVVGGYIKQNQKYILEDKVVTSNQVIMDMIDDKKNVKGFLCNKIYKVEIIQSNRLSLNPKIHFAEDMLFNIQYLLNSDKIKYISEAIYLYEINEGSITKINFSEKRFTHLISINQIIEILERNNASVYTISSYKAMSIRVAFYLWNVGKKRLSPQQVELIKSTIRENNIRINEVNFKLFLKVFIMKFIVKWELRNYGEH